MKRTSRSGKEVPAATPVRMNPVVAVYKLLASYGFTIILLFFLFILTLLGTVDQVKYGLYEAQKRYFESFYVVYNLFDQVPILLPGTYLLLILLTVNLVLGGIVGAPKNWKRPGMLVTHLGILLLLAGGYVTYHYSMRGNMALYEGEQSATFESYTEWEIAITPIGEGVSGKQYVIPGGAFQGMSPEAKRIFRNDALPFDLMIEGYLRNADVAKSSVPTQSVDGFALLPQEVSKEAEQNMPGAYAVVIDRKTNETREGILWGFSPLRQRAPWVVDIAGGSYAIDLRRQRWTAPFAVRLDKFIHEQHPGTSIPSNYESVVTQIEGDVTRQIEIKMNEPLRHKGYTFFQASYGPQNAPPGTKMYSVFEVVNNPADQWPLYSCIIITLGLSLHFIQRLYMYLRQQNRSAS